MRRAQDRTLALTRMAWGDLHRASKTMKTKSLWRILWLALVITACGCKSVSKLAYSVGHFLDPDTCQCPPDSTDCPLCGIPPGGTADFYGPEQVPQYPPFAPRDGFNPHDPAHAGSGDLHGRHVHPPYPHGRAGELGHARATPPTRQAQLNDAAYSGYPPNGMTEELASRNAELIQARSDLSRVQSQVQEVHRDMVAWRQEMQRFQQQLQTRDQQRQAALNDVTGSLAKLVEESTP